MAVPFYKLKEGDKLYKVDYVYDNDGQLIDYIARNLEMARDASIESYLIRFICYDRTFNKNIMFTYDVGYNDDSKYIRNDEEDIKFFLTTSKRRFDIECKKLDKDLNKETNESNDNTDGEEGQDS